MGLVNRLRAATSPYLLQHKDNPVDWWEWFARGVRGGTPAGGSRSSQRGLQQLPLVPCDGARVVRGRRDCRGGRLFPSKELLITAVIEDIRDEVSAVFEAAETDAGVHNVKTLTSTQRLAKEPVLKSNGRIDGWNLTGLDGLTYVKTEITGAPLYSGFAGGLDVEQSHAFGDELLVNDVHPAGDPGRGTCRLIHPHHNQPPAPKGRGLLHAPDVVPLTTLDTGPADPPR
jgi:Protein of unknown function, DUF255